MGVERGHRDLMFDRLDNAEITVEDGVMVIVAETDGVRVVARANSVRIDGAGERWELNKMPTSEPTRNAISWTRGEGRARSDLPAIGSMWVLGHPAVGETGDPRPFTVTAAAAGSVTATDAIGVVVSCDVAAWWASTLPWALPTIGEVPAEIAADLVESWDRPGQHNDHLHPSVANASPGPLGRGFRGRRRVRGQRSPRSDRGGRGGV